MSLTHTGAIAPYRTRSTTNGQIVETLDPEGHTTAISATAAGTTTYGYNRDDQPVTATLPGGLSGSMGYDAANRTSGLTLTDNRVSGVRPITHDAEGSFTSWAGPSSNGLLAHHRRTVIRDSGN